MSLSAPIKTMHKHTFGRDWYDFIQKEVTIPLATFFDSNGLSELREFITIINAIKKLPEPTKENTNWPNTHILIEIRDEFFKHEGKNSKRTRILRVIFNFIIIKYEYDPYYRKRIDWVLDKLFKVFQSGLWASHGWELDAGYDQWWVK